MIGKVVRAPDSSVVRHCVFNDGTLQPQVGLFVRRVGRPRQDWATEVLRAGLEKCGKVRWETLLNSWGPDAEIVWRRELHKCFKNNN